MKNIAEIDTNFAEKSFQGKKDICFYNVKENDFCIFGLMHDEKFRRMPENAAKEISPGVYSLHTNTAGGRLRFITDSPYVTLSVKMQQTVNFPHMPQTGVSGFDLYADGEFNGMFIPPVDISGGFSGIIEFGESKKRNITINFPLYNNVTDLYIGLAEGALFSPSVPYSFPTVIFYGSSITQGGCVSRPGISYTAQISRMLDCDYVNLGFSGSAKGEVLMAEYVAECNPQVFVMDYDHNAPNAEYLKNTHEKFFVSFRKRRPYTPVVMISAPNIRFGYKAWAVRRDIIKETYNNAVSAGDKNVCFIDGETLWNGISPDICTMDCCHPNDIGHLRMAQTIAPIIRGIADKS